MFSSRLFAPVSLKAASQIILAAVVALLSACATTDDMNVLRQDISKLQKDSASMQNELNGIKEKTTGVAKEESFITIRQSQAEMQSTLSNVSRDIQVLSGRFDENKYSVEKKLKDSLTETELLKAQLTALEGQLKEMRKKLDVVEFQAKEGKNALREQSGETGGDPGGTATQTTPDTEKIAKSPPADKKSLYDSAYALFTNKKYKEAREKFELYLKTYPKGELADNAQFWIGETYYREKDFESAILSYEALLKKYPKSTKVASALLKQGLSFAEIGDSKTAKVLLDQVVERFPKTNEAEIAKKKADEISKKQPPKKKK